jgi:hypothetical protein
LSDFAFEKACIASRDIRDVGCFAPFSSPEGFGNSTN